MGRSLALTATLAALACLGLLAANGCPPQEIQETKLLASGGTASDEFGTSISVSGFAAVVGALHDDDNGSSSGSAYVYRFDGTSWVEEAKLLASDGAADDEFGTSVSVSGDVAVVGAPYDDDDRENSGSAYVYRFDGTSWVEEAKLLASRPKPGALFGKSVSVWGDVAVIGAPIDQHRPACSGSAYVYRFDGTSWIEESKLLVSDRAEGDHFGESVSVWGDLAVIGAYLDDDSGSSSGSAYVYRFDGTSWTEEAKLLASDGATNDEFGTSVSASVDVAVIGAHLDDGRGSAYVYRFDGTGWVEEAKLLASDRAAVDGFGHSVSAWVDAVVIAAAGDDDSGASSGSAYLYRFDGTSWMEEAKLLASDGAAYDEFGSSVSVWGNAAVIGARRDGDSGDNSGSTYVFSNLGSTPACWDGIDNDGDGMTDIDDPGCANAMDISEQSSLVACDDGVDNDGDGATDYPDDEGCQDPAGTSEEPECQDGIDNDGDGATDYPDDVGCQDLASTVENPECQDGVNNDPDEDPFIDFDGGLSVLGYVATDPDPECMGMPWGESEGCGIGYELVLLLPALIWLRGRRRSS